MSISQSLGPLSMLPLFKQDFAVVIKLKILIWGKFLGLSYANVITRVLKSGRGRQKSQCQRGQCNNECKSRIGHVSIKEEIRLYTARFGGGGRSYKSRNLGGLQKLKNNQNFPQNFQKEYSPAGTFILAQEFPIQISDLQNF